MTMVTFKPTVNDRQAEYPVVNTTHCSLQKSQGGKLRFGGASAGGRTLWPILLQRRNPGLACGRC